MVTPFLPGDSLLFATGALAATGALDVWLAVILLLAAAIAGDAVNYAVGRSAGPRVIELSRTDPRWRRWINPALHRARARVLRAARRQGDRAGAVHADRAHVRARSSRVSAEMSLPGVRALQRDRRDGVGRASASAPDICSATCPIVKDNFSLVALGIVVRVAAAAGHCAVRNGVFAGRPSRRSVRLSVGRARDYIETPIPPVIR